MRTSLLSLSKWICLATIGLLVATLITTFALLYSPVGLELLVWGAQKALPTLSVATIEGSLGSHITLHDLSFNDNQYQLNLRAKSLSVALDMKSLLQPALCFDYIHIRDGEFSMQSRPQQEGPPPSGRKQFPSPVPIDISDLQLFDITVQIEETAIKWQSLKTGLNWHNTEFRLSPTQLQGITITLPATHHAKKNATSAPVRPTEKSIFSGLQLKDIELPLNFSVPNFSTDDITIIKDELTYTISNLDFGGNTQNSDIELLHSHMVSPDIDLSAEGRIQLQGDYPATLNLTGHYLTDPLKGLSAHIGITGSLADLTLVLVADGPFKTNLKSQLSLTKENFPFAIKAGNTRGQWPIKGAAHYIMASNSLQIHGNLNHYSFDIKGLLKGGKNPELSASIRGDGTPTSVNLTSVELLSSSSYIRGTLQAAWQQNVSLTAQLSLDNFKPELFFPETPGTISGEVMGNAEIFRDGRWAVEISQLDLSGTVKNYPLFARGQLNAYSTSSTMGFAASTPHLVIQHGGNQVSIAGSLTQSLNLALDINIFDLSKSVAQAQGEIGGTIQLTGNPENPLAQLNLVASNLNWQDTFQTEKLSLHGSLISIVQPRGTLQATLSTAILHGRDIDSLQLDLAGSVADHSLVLAVATPEGTGKLQAHGGFSGPYSKWLGELTETQLTHDNETLELQDSVRIEADMSVGKIDIGSHCWGLDGAAICLTEPAFWSTHKGSASLQLKKLSLPALTNWFPDIPVRAEGIIEGAAHINWLTGQGPSFKSAITVAKGQITADSAPNIALGWDSLNLQVLLQNSRLTTQISADITDNGTVSVQTEIKDIMGKDKQLQGSLQLDKININFLQPLLADNNHVHALIDSKLELSGQLQQPQIVGRLTIRDMLASGELFPITVSGGEMDLDFNDSGTTLHGFIRTPDGELNISGDANWKHLPQWEMNGHVTAKSLNTNIPPMVRIQLVPDIRLHLKPGSTRIEGRVKIPTGLVAVEDLPKSAVMVSKDQVVVDADSNPVQSQPLPLNVDTNIEVQIGDELRISAFGLKGKLHGLLKIAQKDNVPFVTGEVNILEGSYRSLGQDLIIQQGNVMFNGPINKPYVAFTAIRNPDNIEDGVTAGLKVTGAAESPLITVFSDPAMAQANALSYLLRGRNLGSDAGDNAMTTTLIGLSLAQSGHLVGDIGQAVGIQDLQLDTTGSGDNSQVTVSGYLLPGLKVKYGVGIFNSVGEFTLRYRLVKNLYVEAVSGLNSAVDLIYQFEF